MMVQRSGAAVKPPAHVPVTVPQDLLDALRAIYDRPDRKHTIPALLLKAAQDRVSTVTGHTPTVSCIVPVGDNTFTAEHSALAWDVDVRLSNLNLSIREAVDINSVAGAMAASKVPVGKLQAAIAWLFRQHDSAESYRQADCRRRWIERMGTARGMHTAKEWQDLVFNVEVASGMALQDSVPARKVETSTSVDETLKDDHARHVEEMAEMQRQYERCRVDLNIDRAKWDSLRGPQRSELYLSWRKGQMAPTEAVDELKHVGAALAPVRPLRAVLRDLQLLEPEGETQTQALERVRAWQQEKEAAA